MRSRRWDVEWPCNCAPAVIEVLAVVCTKLVALGWRKSLGEAVAPVGAQYEELLWSPKCKHAGAPVDAPKDAHAAVAVAAADALHPAIVVGRQSDSLYTAPVLGS